jgi:hypothetical protein
MKLTLTRTELLSIIIMSHPFVTDFELIDDQNPTVLKEKCEAGDFVPEDIAQLYKSPTGKFYAIQRFRILTGLSLSEAKAALENNDRFFN